MSATKCAVRARRTAAPHRYRSTPYSPAGSAPDYYWGDKPFGDVENESNPFGVAPVQISVRKLLIDSGIGGAIGVHPAREQRITPPRQGRRNGCRPWALRARNDPRRSTPLPAPQAGGPGMSPCVAASPGSAQTCSTRRWASSIPPHPRTNSSATSPVARGVSIALESRVFPSLFDIWALPDSKKLISSRLLRRSAAVVVVAYDVNASSMYVGTPPDCLAALAMSVSTPSRRRFVAKDKHHCSTSE